MYVCRICTSKHLKRRFAAREMMFGTRECFEYLQCGSCDSLQIETIPDAKTMQHHYPENYYSFSGDVASDNQGTVKKFLQSRRDSYELGAQSALGFVVAQFKPLPVCYQLFRILKIQKDARILDVGCGGGAFLDYLASKGFHNLKGVDPFNAAEVVTKNGVTIDNCDIHALNEEFDVVMFHHALEHVPDPLVDLQKAYSILTKSGLCIVRIPTSSSIAWERYGEDWVQLDPPRHFTVPSRRGMEILGQRSQLVLKHTIDDSTAFQFWGSEQYKRDVPLFRNGSSSETGGPAYQCDEETMRGYDREAQKANAAGRGDQAAFVYEKP